MVWDDGDTGGGLPYGAQGDAEIGVATASRVGRQLSGGRGDRPHFPTVRRLVKNVKHSGVYYVDSSSIFFLKYIYYYNL